MFDTVLFPTDGSPGAEAARDRGVDLVVLPTRGRRRLPERVLGGVTERVVRISDVPVLTARVDADESPGPSDAGD
ncbi:MAG: universal stress protein [Haloferacaceae archaeon]